MDVPYPPNTDNSLKCIISTMRGFIDESVLSCFASQLPVVAYTPASLLAVIHFHLFN